MSGVTFPQVGLTVVGNETDCVFLNASALEHDPTVTVTTRQYVGGYFPVTVPGRQRTAKVTLTTGSTVDAHVAWLKGHQGTLVCYRDPRGEKFFGIFTDPTFAPSRVPQQWDVSFTLTETYFSDLQ